MTFTFHTGTHRARPLYWLCWFALLYNPKRIARRVTFAFGTMYKINDADQADHNKLFGLFFGSPHSKGHRKKLSWLLGPFFGGNQSAPKKLTLQLKKT